MFKRTADTAFDMDVPVRKDDSVRDYQFYSYHAIQPDLRTRIERQVHDTSKYFIPAEAFVEVEGEFVTNIAANTLYADDPTVRVGFVNNGIMALFESTRYMIDGREIESIERDVDVATTIIGLARYSDDYARSTGPSMMFSKDITDHPNHYQHIKVNTPRATASDPQPDSPKHQDWPTGAIDMIKSVNGDFNLGFATRVATFQGERQQFLCAIPLLHIFGFCRNVRQVIYEAKQILVLVPKGTDHDAIWRVAGVAEGKVVLSKLSLWMPVMTPSITAEERLQSFMDQGGKLLLSLLTVTTDTNEGSVDGTFTCHLTSKQGVSAPRHIVVALQNRARLGSQESNHMIFDQLGVNEVSLRINGKQEPSENILLNYTANHNARVYRSWLPYMGRE